MPTKDDLEWLAGLCDAEACFHAGMSKSRNANVVGVVQVGLVRHDVVEVARRLIINIVGEEVPQIHVRPSTASQREFYSVVIAAKSQARRLVDALSPHLHGKRAEALILSDILGRADGGRYTATDRDRELCELSHRIKKGDVAAKERVGDLLPKSLEGWSLTTAWLAGMLDGDGSVAVARQVRGAMCYYWPIVNISSADRSAIASVRQEVSQEYGVTSLATNKAKGGARQSYTFNIAAEDIERFLAALRPYLRVKAAEVDVTLDVCHGKTTREDGYDLLRRLKREEDPCATLTKLAGGEVLPVQPVRHSRMQQYRRPSYSEMNERGLWSSERARKHFGVGHATWITLIEDLVPGATIGNKKYYVPSVLHNHVAARVGRIVRADARERVLSVVESWNI